MQFGLICKIKFDEIAKIYQLLKLLPNVYTIANFIDPLQVTREVMKIGVLAKRGDEKTLKRWLPLSQYLNSKQNLYHFEIVPLDFDELEKSVSANKIDFVIVNTLYYVLLESREGISRIATLLNRQKNSEIGLKGFGGVIFTRKDNQRINTYQDLIGKKFAAVNEKSFGGWIMGYYELHKNKIEKENLKLSFLETHDDVVKAVLNKQVDAGTVRSDTLEKMQSEGLININDLKILGEKKYENFPYKVSTDLYPEWPFSKLKNTNDEASKTVLTLILNIDEDSDILKNMDIAGWSIPQDYTSVHNILKELEIAPYDNQKITLKKVFEEYKTVLVLFGILGLIVFQGLIIGIYKNRALKHYNKVLDEEVEKQTRELNNANKKLKKLAITDSLTGIYNHKEFMILANKYFDISKRNESALSVISLDIDFFKKVNDTYGHQAGDKVLIDLVKLINKNVRKSDSFGRLGGEEFSIILQNTSSIQAVNHAEKIRKIVESSEIMYGNKTIKITISLGVVTLKDEENINKLMNNADIALYKAKNSGRNKVVLYS